MEDINTTCPIHGDYADPTGRAHMSECPKCEAEARRLEREFQSQWIDYRHWTRCGIPARYLSRTLDNWTPDNANQQAAAGLVRNYAKTIRARVEAGDGLTLTGPPGTGKTHLLAALITAGIQAGIRGRYWSWPALIDTHRSSMKTAPDDPTRQAMDRAADAPLLALDEIGHGTGTEWERLQLFELIDCRYREGLPILVATNATTKTLPDLIGERLADRLQEVNAAIILPGTSQRSRTNHDNRPAINPPPNAITVTECRYGELREREITGPQHGGIW